jgi:hypothetical protein
MKTAKSKEHILACNVTVTCYSVCVKEIIPEHCLLEVLLPEVPLEEMLLPEVEVLLVETKAACAVATEQLNRQDQNSSSQGFLLKNGHKLRFLFTDGSIVIS